MALVTRDQLKAWFKKGLYPLEVQFHHWIDSYWHKNDTIPISSIDRLNQILNNKAEITDLSGKQDRTDPALETQDKTITGAINELLGQTSALPDAINLEYTNEAHPHVTTVAEALDDIYAILDNPLTDTEIETAFNKGINKSDDTAQ